MASTATDILDGVSSSLAVKAPVRVATTAAITLSGEQTIDGVAVVAGDRVLVKSQADPFDNGIYVVKATAWVRAADFNGPRDVVQGTIVNVTSGALNAGYFFSVTTASPVIGATAIEWVDVAVGDTLTIMRWAGTYSGATSYVQGDVVYYEGSSFIYNSTTSGTVATPPASPWETVVLKGAAGAGTGDMLGENNLSDIDDPDASAANLNLEKGVDVQAYDANLTELAAPGSIGTLKVSDGANYDDITPGTTGQVLTGVTGGKPTFQTPGSRQTSSLAGVASAEFVIPASATMIIIGLRLMNLGTAGFTVQLGKSGPSWLATGYYATLDREGGSDNVSTALAFGETSTGGGGVITMVRDTIPGWAASGNYVVDANKVDSIAGYRSYTAGDENIDRVRVISSNSANWTTGIVSFLAI